VEIVHKFCVIVKDFVFTPGILCRYILQCNKLLLQTYAPTIGYTMHKEISRGKSFILSGKVGGKWILQSSGNDDYRQCSLSCSLFGTCVYFLTNCLFGAKNRLMINLVRAKICFRSSIDLRFCRNILTVTVSLEKSFRNYYAKLQKNIGKS